MSPVVRCSSSSSTSEESRSSVDDICETRGGTYTRGGRSGMSYHHPGPTTSTCCCTTEPSLSNALVPASPNLTARPSAPMSVAFAPGPAQVKSRSPSLSPSQSADNLQNYQTRSPPSMQTSTSNNARTGGFVDERKASATSWGSTAIMDRRPSAVLQLGNCNACGEQRRFLISILRNAHQGGTARQLAVEAPPPPLPSNPTIPSTPKITVLEPEKTATPSAAPKSVAGAAVAAAMAMAMTASKSPPPAPPYSEKPPEAPYRRGSSRRSRTQAEGDDALSVGLSALYAKLLFVLGIAFPIAEVISSKVPSTFDQAFYVYLYLVSLGFMIYMYSTMLKDRTEYSVVNSYNMDVEGENQPVYVRNRNKDIPVIRYGSFYLRAGAIAFGIGSMIYSGLEFGQYFELAPDSHCHNVLLALTPAMRMVLTIMQIQFLFLNNRFEFAKYRLVARFGLMHMLATNMCEWLYVLVEEAKHEIMHLSHLTHHGHTYNHSSDLDDSAEHHDRLPRGAPPGTECMRTNIMGSLVQNASPFLFPCTIEYSLICAVILYEMWKNVNSIIANKRNSEHAKSSDSDKPGAQLNGYKLAAGKLIDPSNDHHFSVDCASAHRGLFSGIIILVLTIISLIMFFVLIRDPMFSNMAVFEVNVCEIIMYVSSTIAVIACMRQMRELEYRRGHHGLELDGILIVAAQSGMYVYCLFSIIGSYFSDEDNAPGGLLAELCSLIQTTCQTMLILDAFWRRSETAFQLRRKPGRQLVTFLLVANLAMWTINSLEKNRAEFHPTHLEFYGVWAWTVITHVSMPLAVFYRFHSTVCLLEIWKTAYKMKPEPTHH